MIYYHIIFVNLLSFHLGSGACSDILAKALADFKRTHQQLSANNEISSCCYDSNRSHTQNNDNNDDHHLDNSSIFSSHIHPGVQLGHSRHLHSDYQHSHTNDYNTDGIDAYLEVSLYLCVQFELMLCFQFSKLTLIKLVFDLVESEFIFEIFNH